MPSLVSAGTGDHLWHAYQYHPGIFQATQPGHHSVGRCNEYLRWFQPPLGKKRQVLFSNDCWHTETTQLSLLNELAVNLSRPSSRHGLYASLIGFNARWLKGPKEDGHPQYRLHCQCINLLLYATTTAQTAMTMTPTSTYLVSIAQWIFEVLQHLKHLFHDCNCRVLWRSWSVVDALEVRVGFVFDVLRELLRSQSGGRLGGRRANRTWQHIKQCIVTTTVFISEWLNNNGDGQTLRQSQIAEAVNTLLLV